jgi:hypothetical protein
MAHSKSPFKMSGKSPFMKALVGKQNNLPDALKEKILASPAKQTKGQIEEYRSKSEYLDPSVKRRKNVSDKQVIKEFAKNLTKEISEEQIEKFKKSPVKQI